MIQVCQKYFSLICILKVITKLFSRLNQIGFIIKQLINPWQQDIIKIKQNMEKSKWQTFKESIKQAQVYFEQKLQSKSESIQFLFFGTEGSGKSTSIIILNNQKMIGFYQLSTAKKILTNVNSQQCQIKIKKESREIAGRPQCLQFKNQNLTSKVNLWQIQMPSQSDTQVEYFLINIYFINKLIEKNKKIKLAFTIDGQNFNFSDKGSKVKQVIKQLDYLINCFSDFEKRFVLIITNSKKIQDQQSHLSSFKKNLNQLKLSIPTIDQFLKYIQKNSIPMILIQQPNISNQSVGESKFEKQNYQQIINKFSKLVLTQNMKNKEQEKHQFIKDGRIKQCQSFTNNIKQFLFKIMKDYIDKLSKFIQQIQPRPLMQIQEHSKIIQKITKMNIFIQNLIKIVTINDDNYYHSYKNQDKLNELNQCFKALIDHQSQPNLSKQQDFKILPMLQKVKNQIQDIKLLQYMHFKQAGEQFQWIDRSFLIRSFFKQIFDQKQKYFTILKKQKQKFYKTIQKFVEEKLTFVINQIKSAISKQKLKKQSQQKLKKQSQNYENAQPFLNKSDKQSQLIELYKFIQNYQDKQKIKIIAFVNDLKQKMKQIKLQSQELSQVEECLKTYEVQESQLLYHNQLVSKLLIPILKKITQQKKQSASIDIKPNKDNEGQHPNNSQPPNNSQSQSPNNLLLPQNKQSTSNNNNIKNENVEDRVTKLEVKDAQKDKTIKQLADKVQSLSKRLEKEGCGCELM